MLRTLTDDETGKKTKQTLRCDDGTWTSEMVRDPRLTSLGTVRADGLPMLQAMPAGARTAPRIRAY